MDLGSPGTASGPLRLFCARLKRLQEASGIRQAGLLDAAGLKRSQVSDILNGKIERPPEWGVAIAIVRACLEHAKAVGSLVPPDLSDEADWQRRYFDLEQDLDTGARARPRREASAGRLLAEVTDPFALEVHRPVQPDAPHRGLPALPEYVPRGHDQELAAVVRVAADGGSGIAVLVGGSSTGKTRACWEALGLLRERPERWRLWHPIDPSRPEAALRELGSIGPWTVVWLNEAQFYLDAPGGLGERVAAGLRELLRDKRRAPVLVLATLWPQYWDVLARLPTGDGRHAQARELLAGRDITVPAAFTADQMRQLPTVGDPRLAQAAEAAEGGQVIQFLAGAPELMARYRNAPPAAAALMDAAIDARRLGMGIALPLAFLEQAPPGYLTESEWDGLGENWLEQALAYTAAPCNGIRGLLTRIRPRPARSPEPAGGLAYRLADYLEQHGRRDRRDRIPPADFWDAAARFAAPADLPALAAAAEDRGLLRYAARIRKHATACGDTREAANLVRRWHALHPHAADPRPAQWAAAHASLDDPDATAKLLNALRETGAEQQAAALAARDPAAHASLNQPYAVAYLLGVLREVGAEEQAAVLAARAAAHAPLDDQGAVARLLQALRETGAEEQAAALAARAAAHASLDYLRVVVRQMEDLREAGAHEQAAVLAARAAAHGPLDDLGGVAYLLDVLREVGAEEQAAVLAARAAAHGPLDDLGGVAYLLDVLRRAGAHEQAAVLAARAAAHASLKQSYAVARLLEALREAGAHEQAAVLAARAAAHGSLDHLSGVAYLLDVLREVGAEDQAAALAARAAAHGPLDHLRGVASLLRVLREAGAHEQAAVLAARAAAHGPLDDLGGVAYLLDVLREAGAEEQAVALAARAAAHKQAAVLPARNPATHAPMDSPGTVASQLRVLREAGAHEQAAVLAARAAANAPIYHTSVIVDMLYVLREAGAHEQAAVLAARAVAYAPTNSPSAIVDMLRGLREAGAYEQAAALAARAAAHVDLRDPAAVGMLLDSYRWAGAREQIALLGARAAAHAPLDSPLGVAGLLNMLRDVGAREQAAALLARNPAAHVAIGDRSSVARLLDALRDAGAEEQARTLEGRLPAGGRFDLFLKLPGHQMRYRLGREPDGRPAPPWGWDDLD
jgi:transcriptional regulator with XRE-family HTH domain